MGIRTQMIYSVFFNQNIQGNCPRCFISSGRFFYINNFGILKVLAKREDSVKMNKNNKHLVGVNHIFTIELSLH